MTIQANRIDDALNHLDSLVMSDYLLTSLPWAVAIIVVAAALGVWARKKGRNIWPPLIFFTFVSVSGAFALPWMSYLGDHTLAKEQVQAAYKETISDNFKVADEDMKYAIFTYTDASSGTYSEVRFDYIDKAKMTRYDLSFIFDEETHEPTLLNTGTVDSEIIESLKK